MWTSKPTPWTSTSSRSGPLCRRFPWRYPIIRGPPPAGASALAAGVAAQPQRFEELRVVGDPQIALALLDHGGQQPLELLALEARAGLLAGGGEQLGVPSLVVDHLEEDGALGVGHRPADLAGLEGERRLRELRVEAEPGDHAGAAELLALLGLEAQRRRRLVQGLAAGHLLLDLVEPVHGELLLLAVGDRHPHLGLDLGQLRHPGRHDVLEVEDGPAARHLDGRRYLALLEAEGSGAERLRAPQAGDEVVLAELGAVEGQERVLLGERLEALGPLGLVLREPLGGRLRLALGEALDALHGELGGDLLARLRVRLQAGRPAVQYLQQVIAE